MIPTISAKVKNPMTVRERLAIRILLFAVHIIAPYEFSHEYDKESEEITNLLNKS